MGSTAISSYIVQTDNQKFTVDKKIIESSTLLKNICDITDVTAPIIISCSSPSLEFYINLIKHYETLVDDEHDKEFERYLFEKFTSKNKQNLIKLIKELCILDSDFFLNSAADYILGTFEENMEWNDIQEYLGLENDFSENERKLFENDEKLEYFLSLNTKNFKFPFAGANFYLLKTDFLTPMNVLIARIIQRSSAKISYLLSIINKTIKNEVDRLPFKFTVFNGKSDGLFFNIFFKCLPGKKFRRTFGFNLLCKKYNQKYFNALKKRKVIATRYSIGFHEECKMEHSAFFEYNSLMSPISKTVEITFSKTYKSIYQFDITKYYSSYIIYQFCLDDEKVKFDEIYNYLIARDLSKAILLQTSDIFNFFSHSIPYRMHKKPNASKFYKIEMFNNQFAKICFTFKTFIMIYMEEDGIIESSNTIPGIPVKIVKKRGHYDYPVSLFKRYLEFI